MEDQMIAILLAAASIMPPSTTPGVTNPAVTQANIQQTICAKNWVEKQRPPVEYTDKIKKQMLPAGTSLPLYELDHLISIEIGGSPTDPKNLWPEPYQAKLGAHVKDRVEDALHRAVCAGKIQLRDAQNGIAHDWTQMYIKFVGPLPK
jgi:hypothetical protein